MRRASWCRNRAWGCSRCLVSRASPFVVVASQSVFSTQVMFRAIAMGLAVLFGALSRLHAVEASFTFTNPADRFAPASGPALLAPWDPDASGWSNLPGGTVFDTATNLGIPVP